MTTIKRIKRPIVLPASSASQASVDNATDEIKEVIYKSVGGLDVELNKTASATANGTLVIEPSDGKDVMEKATVTVAVPLEDNKATTIDVSQYASAVEVIPSDGKTAMKKTTVSLSNIPVLESNKAATINVSQYSEAVEVTPSSNKDAMEKATVTLTNIPDIEANKTASITSNGTVEITPSSGKDAMAKTTVTVDVSGEADLEDNKTATINVSEYTQPVEITPSEGKDGMKKATITLSNIPSPSSGTTAYAWSTGVYLSFSVAPATMTQTEIENQMCFYIKPARVSFESASVMSLGDYLSLTVGEYTSLTYERTSDDLFTINVLIGEEETPVGFWLNSEENFTLWQINP